MKRFSILFVVLTLMFFVGTSVSAEDKDAIQKQVDDIVMALDSGKMAEDFKEAAQNEPHYVFILEEGGNTLVHPTLVGKSLKEAAEPVYNELIKATADGNWVDYVWKEKQKHTYVRKTSAGLIVGSGYSE